MHAFERDARGGIIGSGKGILQSWDVRGYTEDAAPCCDQLTILDVPDADLSFATPIDLLVFLLPARFTESLVIPWCVCCHCAGAKKNGLWDLRTLASQLL